MFCEINYCSVKYALSGFGPSVALNEENYMFTYDTEEG